LLRGFFDEVVIFLCIFVRVCIWVSGWGVLAWRYLLDLCWIELYFIIEFNYSWGVF
jgi:hypothetical protein